MTECLLERKSVNFYGEFISEEIVNCKLTSSCFPQETFWAPGLTANFSNVCEKSIDFFFEEICMRAKTWIALFERSYLNPLSIDFLAFKVRKNKFGRLSSRSNFDHVKSQSTKWQRWVTQWCALCTAQSNPRPINVECALSAGLSS